MKKITLILVLIAGISFCNAQSTAIERDSVAQTLAFKTKVKMAAHKAANDLLADNNQPVYVQNYAQIIISSPEGEGWLSALSYGCMTNVAVNGESSDGDIQFTINSLFTKYAKAYYRITD